MLDITKELATNRTLTFVNLSWNYLTSSDKQCPIKATDEEINIECKDELINDMVQKLIQNASQDFDWKTISKENFNEKLQIYINEISLNEAKNPMKKHNEQIIANLSQFIKRNKRLLHLNLDST